MADEEVVAAIPETEVEIVEDAPAALDGDDTTAEPEKVEAKAEERPKRGFQKRIDKLTHEKRELERQLAYLNTPKETPLNEPKRDDFDDYERYIEARADWKVEQRLAKEADSYRQREAEARQREAASTFEETRDSVIEAGIDAYPDFEEVVLSDDLMISEVMRDAAFSSDAGKDLLYHLGKNPAKAAKIASLPPVRQILEMGILEASLKSAKQPSNAPKPLSPVGSRGPGSTGPTDNLSMADWMARRNKQIRG